MIRDEIFSFNDVGGQGEGGAFLLSMERAGTVRVRMRVGRGMGVVGSGVLWGKGWAEVKGGWLGRLG